MAENSHNHLLLPIHNPPHWISPNNTCNKLIIEIKIWAWAYFFNGSLFWFAHCPVEILQQT